MYRASRQRNQDKRVIQKRTARATPTRSGALSPQQQLLSLQRSHGNQAVQRLVGPRPSISSAPSGILQCKLYSAAAFEQMLQAPTITRKYAYRRSASSMKTIVDILENNQLSEAQKLPYLRQAIRYVRDNNPTKYQKYNFPLKRLLAKINETEQALQAPEEDARDLLGGVRGMSRNLRDAFGERSANKQLTKFDGLGSKDRGAIASIVADYGNLQSMLRGGKDPTVKEMTRAQMIVRAISRLKPEKGVQERVADHFPNGKGDPSTLKIDAIYTDPAFFFVGDNPLVAGRHTMLIRFNHAYFIPGEVAQNIFGHDEPQYIMLPGSSFRYRGREHGDAGRYIFEQVG